MYYRFSTFYKRDVNFVYDQGINKIGWLNLRAGHYLDSQNPLIYTVDKIETRLDALQQRSISEGWDKTRI